MKIRSPDGSAGDANYGIIGGSYSRYRQEEPYIAGIIHDALGDAESVLNVGAGAGSYEPLSKRVVAIEPSATMRAQRPAHLPAAIDAQAEHLPFPNQYFDASMATFSVHQWSDVGAGLKEMRRVTKGPVVVLTCDPGQVQKFWLNDYAADVLTAEAGRYPPIISLKSALGSGTDVVSVPIPLNCKDGFNEAYYGRPEMLLVDEARISCSAWSFVNPSVVQHYLEHLSRDLANGAWNAKYRHLRSEPQFSGSLRLIISHR